MGKDIVNFRCVSCGHCCTDVVCLPTPWDVNRIARETGEDPYQFLEFITPDEISEVSKNDPTWLKVNRKKYLMALKRGSKGCYFLDKKTRKCSIYESRPMLCRLYPFALQETRAGEYKSFGLHKDVGCPRHRDAVVQTKPLYEIFREDQSHIDDYVDLVDVFNEEKAGNPSDFISMFYTRK